MSLVYNQRLDLFLTTNHWLVYNYGRREVRVMKRVMIVLTLVILLFVFVGCDYIYSLTDSLGINMAPSSLKTEQTFAGGHVAIKLNSNPLAVCDITPTFDYASLIKYKFDTVVITVTYTVHYVRDSVFSGTPEYSISIMGDDYFGWEEHDVQAPKTNETRTFERTTTLGSFQQHSWKLMLSTDTLIGTIYFEDMVITIKCL